MNKQIVFNYQKTALVSAADIAAVQKKIAPEITRVAAAWQGNYATPYSCMQLPLDTAMHEQIMAVAREKKRLQPAQIILIGIGGSNLGALAVYQALTGQAIDCADSVDSFATHELYKKAESHLKKGENVLLIVISKSGTTTETIANAQLFTALLQRHRANYQDFIVVISDDGSPLMKLAARTGMSHLAIPKQIGGRYSVLSAAGLFPLAMMDVNIHELCAGAASTRSATATVENNPAALRAAIVYFHAQRGAAIYDHFFFVPRLAGLGQWVRQLLAESLGKSQASGILPTVSIGSADLHSVAQLYLGGKNNRVTSLITVREDQQLVVPTTAPFITLVPDIAGKTYHEIMNAIITGVETAYTHQQRAFFTLELPAVTPYFIGQFMHYALIETIYLGALFGINAFDQPHVELYKTATRKILADE